MTQFELLQSWKEQTKKECSEWVMAQVNDEQRLTDYQAGISCGWEECIRILKLHDMIKRNT